MTANDDFDKRNRIAVAEMGASDELHQVTRRWFEIASKHEYSYHFEWMGRPIIQFPQDIIAQQEIIWNTQPDLIIETGVARGGSVVFYSSMLALLGGEGRVIGIDIEIRPHNRAAIESHPMFDRIELIEGSSTDRITVARVAEAAKLAKRVMVVLDSKHSAQHVSGELEAYSPLVTKGCYLCVFDTIIETMPPEFSRGRPWGPGDSPYTAVQRFLKKSDRFELDRLIEDKLQVTVAPGGYLRCTKD